MNNFQDKTNFLWSIADLLRDDFRRSKHPDVILPFTALRRVDCVLEPTKEKVLARYQQLKGKIENLAGQLTRASGYVFYNISPYDFSKLLDDPQNVGKNLRAYIVNLLFSQDRDVLSQNRVTRIVFDPACGTGGMLTIAKQECRARLGQQAQSKVYASGIHGYAASYLGSR